MFIPLALGPRAYYAQGSSSRSGDHDEHKATRRVSGDGLIRRGGFFSALNEVTPGNCRFTFFSLRIDRLSGNVKKIRKK